MLRAIFIRDEHGDYYSSDGTIRYKRLHGEAIKSFFSTDRGKLTRLYIVNNIGIEIVNSDKEIIRRDERHRQYIADTKRKHPYICVSISTQSDDGLSGEEVLRDESVDVQETVLNRIMSEQVRKALEQLDESERQLIEALFFHEPKISQAELAKKNGMTQQAVSYRLAQILRKLRKILQ